MPDFTLRAHGWECDDCAALVISTSRHHDWHEKLDRALNLVDGVDQGLLGLACQVDDIDHTLRRADKSVL